MSTLPSWAHRQSLPHAVAMLMLSVACYAIQDVLIKLLPTEISVFQICFFRALFAFIPILALFPFENRSTVFKSDQWGMHFWRSFFATLSLFFYISSFRLIPLADAYSLTFSCPLFMTALSIPFLKEKVPIGRWLAVITGFTGVLIALQPGSGLLQLGGYFAVIGGFFYATSLVLVRKLSHHHQDSNALIVTTFTSMSLIVTAPILPFVWVPFEWSLLPQFVMIGVLGGAAQYAITQALRMAPVSQVAPFEYIALIWALVFGYLFFNEVPNILMAVGAILIIGSGLFILRSEKVSIQI
jgi:drug/metabolite transporter (DMT)-like permease